MPRFWLGSKLHLPYAVPRPVVVFVTAMVFVVAMYAVEEALTKSDTTLFRPFAIEVESPYYAQPYYGDTTPSWVVKLVIGPVCALIVALAQALLVEPVHRRMCTERTRRESAAAVLAVALAVYMTSFVAASTTGVLKLLFPSPRPYFGTVCLGAGYVRADGEEPLVITDLSQCPGGAEAHDLYKACQSFPSGHTAQTVAFVMSAVMQICYATCVFQKFTVRWKVHSAGRPHGDLLMLHAAGSGVGTLAIMAGMMVIGAVSISRVTDHAHFFSNVFAGGIVGVAAVALCFLPTLVFANKIHPVERIGDGGSERCTNTECPGHGRDVVRSASLPNLAQPNDIEAALSLTPHREALLVV